MRREMEFRKLWETLSESDNKEADVKDQDEKQDVSEENETSLDALIARLEDLVSRLENAVNNSDTQDKEEDPDKEEPKKENAYRPRRISRRCRDC